MDEKTQDNIPERIRQAVADYMGSEGCGCCDRDAHKEHKRILAGLFNVPMYSDGSGYDFNKFSSYSVSRRKENED